MEDKDIAMGWLKQAISNRNSEYPISQYISFMDTLPKPKRDVLLIDKDITLLIDKINRYHLGG